MADCLSSTTAADRDRPPAWCVLLGNLRGPLIPATPAAAIGPTSDQPCGHAT
jgi:hypothetical protein